MLQYFYTVILFICSITCYAQYEVHTIAFYNVENLFDTVRNDSINDESFTPEGSYQWDTEKYENKLTNIATVLSGIGTSKAMKLPPTIIGLSEVENKTVLEDLLKQEQLKKYNYKIIHRDSPDERGIDNAILYQADFFDIENVQPVFVELPDTTDRTRDILLVSGTLSGESIHLLVNHWPSRSGGQARSEPNRFAAAHTLKQVVDSIYDASPQAKIIAMGDFNDDPVSPSLTEQLGATTEKNDLKGASNLYNPYGEFYKKGFGTTAWRDAWSLFDMIIVNEQLIDSTQGFRFVKADRYYKDFLLQQDGRFKGYPKRTHSFGNYLNGYSDHLPVYIYIARKVN